jgi:hypothetical protein
MEIKYVECRNADIVIAAESIPAIYGVQSDRTLTLDTDGSQTRSTLRVFFFGILAPDLHTSLKAIPTAYFRLVTFLPLPGLSVTSFFFLNHLLNFFCAIHWSRTFSWA